MLNKNKLNKNDKEDDSFKVSPRDKNVKIEQSNLLNHNLNSMPVSPKN